MEENTHTYTHTQTHTQAHTHKHTHTHTHTHTKAEINSQSNLKESLENIKSIIFQSHASKVDQNKNYAFSYCCIGLGAGCTTKKTNDSFFRRTLS